MAVELYRVPDVICIIMAVHHGGIHLDLLIEIGQDYAVGDHDLLNFLVADL